MGWNDEKRPRFLDEPDPERAWRLFLEDCSGVVERAVGRVVADEEERRNVAVEVLSRLRADWPALLRRYEEGRRTIAGSFRPWLSVVARNLGIDVLRSLYGRPTLPRSVARMPPWKQLLYRLLFREGVTTRAAWETLRAEGVFEGGLAELALEARTLEEELPRSACIASAGIRRPERGVGGDQAILDPEARGGATPASRLERGAAHAAFERVLANLSAEERLLLRSYHLEGATARDTARLLGTTPTRVYGQVRSLLDRIQDAVLAAGLGPEDIEELMDFDWFANLPGEEAR